MPLFRRPEEEHVDEEQLSDVTVDYNIQLTGYADGSWHWRMNKEGSYHTLESGVANSRSEALSKAQSVAKSNALSSVPVVNDNIKYTVRLKGNNAAI